MGQTTNNILMVSPKGFLYNLQTAQSNTFQSNKTLLTENNVTNNAIKEFEELTGKLYNSGINVIIADPKVNEDCPDAVFPNNWVTFHNDGSVVLYPMYAPNRRKERQHEILDFLVNTHSFKINNIFDMSKNEESGLFLEGTGSMVFDRENKIAYAALSVRTSEKLVNIFSKEMGYKYNYLNAFDVQNKPPMPVYHTNVIMSIGTNFAVVCLESMTDEKEKKNIKKSILKSGKQIIDISFNQVKSFAGNILELKDAKNEPLIVMSTNAYESLEQIQLKKIERHGRIIHSSLDTIEKFGGGSARCMIAEVFLPKTK